MKEVGGKEKDETMERSTVQQAVDLIKKSGNIVIVLPRNPSTDAIASGLGFFIALEKIGKKAKVVCNEFMLPPSHQFLPKSGEIHTELSALRKFIITLDLTRTKVEELSYNISDDFPPEWINRINIGIDSILQFISIIYPIDIKNRAGKFLCQ